jgi:hypothetical protein
MVPTSFSFARTAVSLLLVKRPASNDSYEERLIVKRSLHLNAATP